MGYAGGTTPSPTYRSIGDHAETVQVDFDPGRVAYEELLAIFLQGHDPTARAWSRQYMSAVFYHDDTQRRAAQAALDGEARRRGAPVRTELLAFTDFHLAEAYHQKYYLRREADLLRSLQRYYPTPDGLVHSTAAARVNGYLGGHGRKAGLDADIDRLGLTGEGRRKLAEVFRWRSN